MKRLFTGLLLFIFLFGQTEFAQVFRLPVLFTHYFEHRAGQDISFGQFMAMHYAAGNSGHHDARHAQLPFKTSALTVAAAPVIPQFHAVSVHFFFQAGDHVFPQWRDRPFFLSPVADIWQPPRKA